MFNDTAKVDKIWIGCYFQDLLYTKPTSYCTKSFFDFRLTVRTSLVLHQHRERLETQEVVAMRTNIVLLEVMGH